MPSIPNPTNFADSLSEYTFEKPAFKDNQIAIKTKNKTKNKKKHHATQFTP